MVSSDDELEISFRERAPRLSELSREEDTTQRSIEIPRRAYSERHLDQLSRGSLRDPHFSDGFTAPTNDINDIGSYYPDYFEEDARRRSEDRSR